MQLSAANRRDVIEDLLDIRIFSSMNSVIKENSSCKEELKVLELKKESLNDKVQMQQNLLMKLKVVVKKIFKKKSRELKKF